MYTILVGGASNGLIAPTKNTLSIITISIVGGYDFSQIGNHGAVCFIKLEERNIFL